MSTIFSAVTLGNGDLEMLWDRTSLKTLVQVSPTRRTELPTGASPSLSLPLSFTLSALFLSGGPFQEQGVLANMAKKMTNVHSVHKNKGLAPRGPDENNENGENRTCKDPVCQKNPVCAPPPNPSHVP